MVDVYSHMQELIDGSRIRLVAGLPDDWTRPVIDWFRDHPDVNYVSVAREAEAVAIISGAFFTGTRGIAIMGATGLLTCLGELATLNLRHQIPLFILVSGRGSIRDHRVYQEIQGRRLRPALASLDIPWIDFTAESVGGLGDAYTWSRVQKRPVVAFLPRDVLKEV